jgi:hypothetical protein
MPSHLTAFSRLRELNSDFCRLSCLFIIHGVMQVMLSGKLALVWDFHCIHTV